MFWEEEGVGGGVTGEDVGGFSRKGKLGWQEIRRQV